MTEVSYVFILAGIVILAGFFGNLFFERTGIPDVLLLLTIGILLGPISGLVDPARLHLMAEYVGSLALLVILFEGGMDLELDKLLREFGSAFLLVVLAFFLTTFGIASFLRHAFGWEFRQALMLGGILGCTSAAIVIPIVNRMNVSGEVKTTLSVESALSDVLAVVLTVSLIDAAGAGRQDPVAPVKAVAASFSTAIIVGAAAGLGWLKVLDLMRGKKLAYMLTLAAVLVAFGGVGVLGGSGSIAVLVIGLVLGNSGHFNRYLKIREPLPVDQSIRILHEEVSFFVRTFFFVYLGMMFSFDDMTSGLATLCGGLVLLIVLVRMGATAVTAAVYPQKAKERFLITLMMPRGLASAVLATLPAAAGVPGTEPFVPVTFGVIIVTNVLLTTGMCFAGSNRDGRSSG